MEVENRRGRKRLTLIDDIKRGMCKSTKENVGQKQSATAGSVSPQNTV